MSDLVFTPKQQEAIELRGKDMCVVAGPGAGKTAVLIERFVRLVGAGISIHRILAITFTEKAATQLRERLNKAYAGTPLEEQIERAWITTIDGFCARLLKENAIAARVDPDFRVLDEREAPQLEADAATEALDALLAERPEAMRGLLGQLASPDLGRAITTVHAAMRASGATLAEVRTQPLPATGGWERLLGEAAALTARPPRAATPAQTRQLQKGLEWARNLLNLKGRPIGREHFEALASFPGGRLPDALVSIRDEFLRPATEALTSLYFAGSRNLLFDALERFEAVYRRRKFELGGLDFADLEDFAVDLLTRDAEVRERVRGQFEHVMMDEFQDINRVQDRLMELVRPPDRFYAVGDINQSIYGFRNADPDVFREYRARVDPERVVELRANFRSRSQILAAAVTVMRGAAGIEPHILEAKTEFPLKNEPCLEVISVVAPEGADAAQLEARHVARRIRELEGKLMLRKRLARFEDFALLVRNSNSIAPFAAAFEAEGIPYQVDRGRGFFEALEVRDSLSFLKSLANPRDEIATAALLRSPLVGLADESLFLLHQAGGLAQSLSSPEAGRAAGLEPGDRDRLGAFTKAFTGWREERFDVSADRLLARAMDRTGYQAGLSRRASANVDKLLGMLRFYAAAHSIDGVIEELERLSGEGAEADAAVAGAAEGVAVMTVHSAKGLEFPVVLLAALEKGVDNRLDPVCYSPRHGLGGRWRNPAGGRNLSCPVHSRIQEERSVRDSAESERLFYVGMTRAEEHLVLSFANTTREWAALVGRAFQFDLAVPAPVRFESFRDPSGKECAVRVLVTGEAPEELPEGERSEVPQAAAWREPLGLVAGQHDSTASVTSISLFNACPRRYYLSRYLGIEGTRRPPLEVDAEMPPPEPDALDASEFGAQVHAILGGVHTGPALPEAGELARRFTASKLGRRAAAASQAAREYDFVMAVEDVVLRGQIDLWFEHAGKLVLVDYKTDAVSLQEASSHARDYELQMRLYAMALERVTGRLPDEAWLYFLRLDTAVPVNLAPLLLLGAEGAVRDFREAQDRLEFPLQEADHCRRCPFFRGLCPANGITADPPTVFS